MDHMKHALPVLLTACALIAAGCGGDDSDEPSADKGASERAQEVAATTEKTQPAEQPAAEPARRRRRGPLVKLRDSQLGPVLFSGRDRAVYFFTRDGEDRSRCYGGCAEAWPPFIAKGRPRPGDGVDRSLLGTIKRRDGSRQVTYKGQPLYFYVSDPRGQVLCNDIVEFGGTWYALDAQGNAPA
jgi:predicted lipoprotein with Yx(FWY)xxD motif